MPAGQGTWCTWTSRRSVASPMVVGGEPTAAAPPRPSQETGPRPPGPSAGTCTCTPRWTGSPGSPTPNSYPTRRPPRRPRSGNGPAAFSPPMASRRSTASSPTTAPSTAPPNSLAASATAVTNASPRTPHATTGRSSGTTGSSPRSSTCARCYGSEDERRQALAVWNCHYNYHRPHTATGNQPPASKVHHVINAMASYNYRARADRLIASKSTTARRLVAFQDELAANIYCDLAFMCKSGVSRDTVVAA